MTGLEITATKAAGKLGGNLLSWGFKQLLKSDFTPYENELKKIILVSLAKRSKGN